jgi:hypothetical protein
MNTGNESVDPADASNTPKLTLVGKFRQQPNAPEKPKFEEGNIVDLTSDEHQPSFQSGNDFATRSTKRSVTKRTLRSTRTS